MKVAGARRLYGAVFLAGALALILSNTDSRAAERLNNPGFETWPISPGWHVSGSASPATEPAIGNFSAELSGGPEASVFQMVSATPHAAYSASIRVAANAANPQDATLTLSFRNASGLPIGGTSTSISAADTQFRTLTLQHVAPAQTALVEFRLHIASQAGMSAHGWVDAASLLEQQADTPTPTPTSTPTPTFTPVPATATPTLTTVPATNTPSSAPPATATPTATRRPSGTTPPPGGSGGTNTATPVPTATPTPRPSATPTPTETVEPFGGLLRNGNFEQGDADGPVHWTRFGGVLGRTSNAYRGDWSAEHASTTSSTKWIFQTAAVQGGSWYSASARARVSHGNAELFIRVSWYASPDGSGSYIEQADSPLATGSSWTSLATGAIRAPANARSARVRLMLRPFGNATAHWDDALFVTSAPATPTPVPTATAAAGPGSPTPGSGSATATPSSGGGSRSSAGGRSSGTSSGGSTTVQVEAGEDAQGGSLLLSEVMSDPDVSGDNNLNEWVEVYNPTAERVDLGGWVIADRSRGSALPSLLIEPEGYAIIAARDTEVPERVPFVRVEGGRIGYGLRNPGDAVLLFAPDGTLVDAMSYGDNDRYGPGQPEAPPKGETLGRPFDGPDPGPWQLTLRPTPGEANVFPETEDDEPPEGSDEIEPEANEEPDAAVAGEPAPDRPDVPIGEPGGMSPIAWIIIGAAAGAGVVGTAPFVPAGWRRLKRLRHRGD